MSLLKNKEELCLDNTEPRRDALDILEAGLEAIDTEKILRTKVSINGKTICVSSKGQFGIGFQCEFFERIFFIGVGKCAFDGARVMEEMLGENLTDGIVIDVKSGVLKKIKSFEGTHPYPSETNVSVTKQILDMVKGVTEKDLVLTLISGGGSSLLCLPHDMNCESLSQITKALTEKGADIYELNTVRKHISEIQGGSLAKILYPAQVVSLIFSDVLGDDMSIIASGPTVKDETTSKNAADILEKYDIINQCKLPGCKLIETPKEDIFFRNVKNFLIASNSDALEAMKNKAEEFGYHAKIESKTLSGKAREVGKMLAHKNIDPKECLLFGGETTVEVKGKGVGGRNQEVALSALADLSEGVVLIAAASDGFDNTDCAGAVSDVQMRKKTESLNLNPQKFLDESDSYNFWKACGGAISTGRLESNVSDLFIILRDGK